MTQEDKELLLKDLCARASYGVICHYDCTVPSVGKVINYDRLNGIVPIQDTIGFMVGVHTVNALFDNIKPYLRPLSSMTEEEKKDILQSLNIHGDIDNEGNLRLGVECNIITLKVCKKYLGELNKRMFDICHMIEKGLALEAPKGMYNIKKK